MEIQFTLDHVRRQISKRARAQKTQLKKKRMQNSRAENLDTAMDDVHLFKNGVAREEVVLGVYGTEEWFVADLLRNRHLSGLTTVQVDVTWLVPASFKLIEWAAANAAFYTFFGANRVIVQTEDGLLKVTHGRGKIEVEHIGDPVWVQGWISVFDIQFKRAENLIEWVYSSRGDEISVPLNYRPAIPAAYPWIKKDLIEYIDDYLNSEASVLILIGQPGTGKTTFIKNLIHRSGANAKVAYDEKVMMEDSLFAGFIDDESRFLIMEDADAFLQSRTDGNTMMHKFLNVSDGLISAADKKMVFSTNLPNMTDIDPALMRPGRCFDVLEFRPLTRLEADAVIQSIGHGSVPPGKDFITLAELFSIQPSEGTRRKKGIGFTS